MVCAGGRLAWAGGTGAWKAGRPAQQEGLEQRLGRRGWSRGYLVRKREGGWRSKNGGNFLGRREGGLGRRNGGYLVGRREGGLRSKIRGCLPDQLGWKQGCWGFPSSPALEAGMQGANSAKQQGLETQNQEGLRWRETCNELPTPRYLVENTACPDGQVFTGAPAIIGSPTHLSRKYTLNPITDNP